MLVRHGRTAANATGALAGLDARRPPRREGPGAGCRAGRAARGRAPGRGRDQPARTHRRRPRPCSPARTGAAPRNVDDRVGECRYGDWTGRNRSRTLAKDPLWKVVQAHPSAVVFPGTRVSRWPTCRRRAVGAVRDWNARLSAAGDADYVSVSHGDVIKAIIADALGHAPRRVPAAPGGPLLGHGDPLHRPAPVRAAHQRHRRRPVLARAAAEDQAAQPQGVVRRGRRRRRRA